MKKVSLFKFAALFFAVCIVAGLQSCTNTKPVEPSELEGYWVLKTLNGQEANTLFEDALPTLQFDFQKMTIFGTGGCNRYTGAFTFKDNVLSAPNLASTKMLCFGKNEEVQFFLELGNPLTISVEGSTLTLSNRDKVAVMVFEKGEEPKEITLREKVAGSWTLKQMEGNDVKNLFKGDKYPTAVFSIADNKVSGNAGCNSYGSVFSIDDSNRLIIAPIVSTQMACPDLEGEALFIKNLADTSDVNVTDENILQIMRAGMVMLEFEKTAE